MGKKLRFKVGYRVTCARRWCVGSTGRILRRAPATAANGQPGPEWVVRLDQPVVLSSGTRLEESWYHDDDLEPWTVPPEARPVSVGALHHSEVRRG